MQANVLSHVYKGMKVFDAADHEIGKVDWVKFGEDDPDTAEVESASPPIETRDDTIIDDLARAFRPSDLPEELRDRLLEEGFVRLDAGLLSGERYILPEQISGVSDDRLILNVEKDDLLKH